MNSTSISIEEDFEGRGKILGRTMPFLRKSLIFFLLLFFIEFSSGRDTLSIGQTLKGKDYLISAKETFTLGFFSIGMSTDRYLGIYYSDLPENKVIWVANRDSPVNDSSGFLSFQKSNNLVIYGSDLKKPIWLTSFLGPGKNYSAQLLDTGNLVVFEEGNSEFIAWQSFEHPTDTWLPEMKLGVNRKTGLSLSLTSWKSLGDPGTGRYSFKIDVIHEFLELSLCKGSNRIWRSGPLNGARLGEISPMYIFNVTYVDNGDEVYMTYSMRKPSILSVIAVIPYGLMRVSEWNPYRLNWTVVQSFPKEWCDDYNRCGPNKYCDGPSTELRYDCSCFPGFEPNQGEKLGGCVRKGDYDPNVCRKGEGFVKLSNMKMPDTTTARAGTRGLKECEEECLRACNCTAYANATENGIACVMWYGNLLDTRKYEIGGQDLFVRVESAENGKKQQHYSSSNKKYEQATWVIFAAVVVAAASFVIFRLCWLAKKTPNSV